MLELLRNPTFMTATAVAIVTGGWAWFAGRTKNGTEAQVALVGGFKELLAEFREERKGLIIRLSELERDNKWMERRISQLEKTMQLSGIEIPPAKT